MKAKPRMPDWAAMIDDLVESGMDLRAIGVALSWTVTPRMVAHLRFGVQPLPRRGAAITALWCERMKCAVEAIPVFGEARTVPVKPRRSKK